MLRLDTSTEFGARVARRLNDEQIVWLTTVGADGTPQPSPVWFLWDGAALLIYSRPNTAKLRNIARNPHVALSLNSDEHGGDVVILTGEAQVIEGGQPASAVPPYVEKYGAAIKDLGYTVDAFAQEYSVPIQVVPRKLRGF